MNASLLPMYGATFLVKRLRKLAASIDQRADHIEACRSLTKQQNSVLQRNAAFADKHKASPAFVIVNGPSLANQDIMCLKDQITFVASGFWKHEAVLSWQPTYYSLSDANFFNDNPPTQSFYQSLNKRIHSSTFFVPLYRGFDAVRNYGFLPAHRTYYIASVGANGSSNDLTKVVQGFGSVSAFALSQAIYMGCSPIYLLGFDHDYLANRGVDRHFYTGGTIAGHKLADVPLAERIPYDDEMRANLGLWSNYRALKAIADKKGVQIFNCTRGGYLDVFPRLDYESLDINR
jgi:hypothetical protein